MPVAHATSRTNRDYAPENHGWNGLADFFYLLDSLPVKVRFVRTASPSELEKIDVLFLLYPTQELPQKALSTFVQRGGRLILADDFGRSDRFLASLGVHKKPILRAPKEFRYRGRAQVLVARRRSLDVSLAARTDHLVTNHPMGLDGPGDVLYDIAGQPVVLRRKIGKGRILLLGDPSLFINDMLAFPSNRAFLLAVVQWASPGGRPTRIFVAAGSFRLRARQAEMSRQSLWGRLRQAISAGAHALNHIRPSADSIDLAALLLAGLVLALMALRLPLRRIRYDGHWVRIGSVSYHAGFASRFLAHANPKIRTYVEPACLIRNRLDDFLERHLHVTSPLTLLSARQVERMLALHYDREAAELFSHMQALLRRLPLNLAPGGPPPPRFSFRSLARLDQLSSRLIASVERQDRPQPVSMNGPAHH